MLAILALVFVVVPMVELYVIVQVGYAIGFLNTIGVMIAVSVVGAWLARHEGFWVLQRIREQIEAGRVPTDELVDAGLVLAGGLLLVTPGFVSDCVGIVALFPPTRALLRRAVKHRLRLRVIDGRLGGTPPEPPDDVIDV